MARVALLGVALVLALAPAARAQTVWHAPMLDELDALADTATVEHFRCLLGGIGDDGEFYVVLAYAPKVVFALPYRVRTELCPPVVTVAVWHNHLPFDFAEDGENLGARRPMWEYCYLSEEYDQKQPYGFQVVHVRSGVSCAFVRQGGRWKRVEWWPPKAPADTTGTGR